MTADRPPLPALLAARYPLLGGCHMAVPLLIVSCATLLPCTLLIAMEAELTLT